MKISGTATVAVASLLFAGLAGAQTLGTLSFADDATVRLTPGTTGGRAQIYLKAEGLKAEAGKMQACEAEEPVDVGGAGPSGPTVKFAVPTAVERGATTCLWLVPSVVTGLPAQGKQKRFARVKAAELEQVIAYTLSNLAPDGFTWNVAQPPNPWLVWYGPIADRTLQPIVVTTKDSPATGLRMVQGGLRDTPLASEVALTDLELCPSETGCGAEIAPIAAHSVRTLFLRLRPTRYWVHGKYSGNISFAVNERTELQSVTLNLHASSWFAWLLGLALLAAGTWLGWWTNVWARSRVLRLEALQPIHALQESIAAVAAATREAPAGHEPATIAKALSDRAASITPSALDRQGLLPPSVPNPFGSPDRAADLKLHLQDVIARVDGLAYVVHEGLKVLWPYVDPANNARGAAIKALKRLDKEGAEVASEAAAVTLVDQVLKDFADTTTISLDAMLQPELPTPGHELTWQIGRILKRVWITWGMVTIVTGAAALILSNAGFGTALDLVFCFLWGVGLPAAVDKLQQLNPAGVGSHLNLTLPKGRPAGG